MRRLALAATIPLLCTCPIYAQSQVQNFPKTAPDSVPANGPIPSGEDPTHPSTPNPAGKQKISPEEQERQYPLRLGDPDRDQLTGHLRIGAGASYGTFSGSFLDSASIGANLGGAVFGVFDVGFGLSRHLELVLAGDFSKSSAGAGCETCSATSWAIGPQLRYHLVEGARFSPWLAVGMQHRNNQPRFPGAPRDINSLEFLRLAIGGDWYATSNVAFGPNFGFGIATAYSPPEGAHREVFALLHAGLRLVFDFPGR